MNSVDEVVSDVRKMLASGPGKRQVARVLGYLEALVELSERLGASRAVMNERKEAVFFATVGNLMRQPPQVDVRIKGRLVGQISVAGRNLRKFRPVDPWKKDLPRGGADWANKSVREFLEARQGLSSEEDPEAKVQSALFLAMRERKGSAKPSALHNNQPVQVLGMPFQFPLPVSASGGTQRVSRGNALGHADIVARHGPGHRIRVFEIKMKGGDAEDALRQGVAYAAAMEHLLDQDSSLVHRALGYSKARKKPPKVEVWAFVHESDRAKAVRGGEELARANQHYSLHVMPFTMRNGELEIGESAHV